jgi:hypothetical protein
VGSPTSRSITSMTLHLRSGIPSAWAMLYNVKSHCEYVSLQFACFEYIDNGAALYNLFGVGCCYQYLGAEASHLLCVFQPYEQRPHP